MIPYTLIRSSRRTVSVSVTPAGAVIVRAPRNLSGEAISRIVEERSEWILLQLMKAELREPQPVLTEQQTRELLQSAREDLPRRVETWAPVVGVTYNRVSLRFTRSQWGSCSSTGNLSLNVLLMLVPEAVRDYVVVHELCHRKQMNHSREFWAEVEWVLPDYRACRKWLKDHGGAILARRNPSG